jgi:hypothetical protein
LQFTKINVPAVIVIRGNAFNKSGEPIKFLSLADRTWTSATSMGWWAVNLVFVLVSIADVTTPKL